ncbi:MAG: glycosyltransferase [Chloroflexota bacterium]
MRIGLITGEYPPLEGGVGHYTALLAENLVVQGHPTFIFSNHHAEQHNDIPVNNTISKWNYRTNQLIKQWTSEKDLDVVNLQFQTAAYDMSAWIHFMPHMVNVPYVTTFHDLRFPYLFPKAGKLRNWIVMHLAKASDEVIATNHEDYAQLAHLKATMIPIGSNIKRVKNFDCDATRQQLNFSSDDFVLAYFGFMNHSKGVDTLLYAMIHKAKIG